VTEGFKDLPGSRSVRFGCGAIAGLLFGFYAAVQTTSGSTRETVISVLAGALIFGLLSAVFGDRFWAGIHRWLWWR
jgi:hypothetical protein